MFTAIPADAQASAPTAPSDNLSSVEQTLVVIDSAVDEATSLAAAVKQDKVIILRSGEGITEITAALNPGVQQLMIVAHGEPGVLYLGGVAMTAEQLYQQRSQVQAWTVDEIVLCSCRVGAAFGAALTRLTGSRVVTSHEVLGAGNWLPQMWDVFDAKALQAYGGTLAPKVTEAYNGFATQSTFAVGEFPLAAGVGDFDGDGKQDLAIANNTDGNVSILLGNGSGSFSAQTTFTVGSGANSVSVGDFNRDGKADLAITNSGSGTVTVLRGNGSGGFNASSFITGTSPRSVSMTDFNGDGNPDLAIANSGSNNVSLILGNGIGGIVGPQLTFPVGTSPRSLSAGDFNGDGKPDLAIANFSSNSVSVLLSMGSAGFSAQTSFATGTNPNSVSVGDFNGDGKLDLAIANQGSNSVSVLLGNGSGGFSAQTTFAAGTSPRSVTVGDVNNDGNPDLAIANSGNNNASVLLGNGSGGFSAQTTFATGPNPIFVTLGDFTGDGKSELAIVNALSNNVSILRNKFGAIGLPENGTYTVGQTLTFTVNFDEGVSVTGVPVLPITLGNTPVNATYQSGNGTKSLTFTYTVAFSNIDNDGITLGNAIVLSGGTIRDTVGNDAILTLPAVNTTGLLVDAPVKVSNISSPQANGSYGISTVIPITLTFAQPVTLTGNLIVTLTTGATFTIPSFSGATTTGTYTVAPGQSSPDLDVTSVVLAAGATLKDSVGNDVNLAVLPTGANSLAGGKALVIDGLAPVVLGAYNGFAAQSTFATGTKPQSISVGDFNGDGKADLAIANIGSDNVSVLLGNGSGGFGAQTTFAVGTRPVSITTSDLNGDGKLDLAIANFNSNNVSVLLGSGSGGFSTQTTLAAQQWASSVAVGDFNNDGKRDLAVTNFGVSKISLFLGNGNGSFSAQSTFVTGLAPVSLSVSDFNGDGKLDLVTANYLGDNASILLGDGSGSFAAQMTSATGTKPQFVSVGDFNGDGNPDLAIANNAVNTVSVLLGNGSGGFAAQTTFATGTTPSALTVSDFDGDGKLDLVITNYASNNISVLLGNGSGGFSPQTTLATGLAPNSVKVGDFNGDNRPDLAIANYGTGANNVSILLSAAAPAMTIPANGTYRVGQPLTFTVSFSETVAVTGIPVLPLTIGSSTVNATYVSGTNTKVLTFTYTLGSGDRDADGIVLGGALSGGTIKDATGNNAILTLPSVNSSGILVDAVVPTISAITSTTNNGSYGIGSTVNLTATFNKPVTLADGNFILTLDNGATVNITSISGTNTASGTYTVATGQNSSDLNVTAIALASGATLKDSSGNDVTLTPPTGASSLAGSKDIIIDTTEPIISSITSTTANGSYGVGSSVNVTVNFSENVTLTNGNLILTLDNGATVNITSISGTNTAAGIYTVVAGQSSSDLNVTAIALASGATLKDAAGNSANLAPLPTGANSLAGNKAIVIDTLIPIGRSAPVISGTPTLTVAEDTAYSFTPTATDPDPEVLTFAILNKPTWATFNPTTGKLSGTPANADVGTAKNITISVNDGTDTVNLPAFNLTVTNINDAPVVGTPIILTANQNIIALQPFAFPIPSTAFADADAGDALTFSLTNANGNPLPNWLKFDVKTAILSGIPDSTSIGDLNLKVTAIDRQGGQVSQNFTVAIATPAGSTGIATSLIDFAGGKKGITRKATKGKLLRGTKLSDVLYGTNGNDRIKSGKKSDRFGKDKVYGLEGSDRISSGGGNDSLDGGKGNDILKSSKGRDLLLGGEGNDKLLGGDGEDILVGGQGTDMLTGGANKDMFTFGSANDGVDTITDFNLTEDVIDLRVIFNQPQFEGATPFVRYLQQIKLVQVGNNTEVQIDIDGTGNGTTLKTLAVLQNISASAVTGRNFVIV